VCVGWESALVIGEADDLRVIGETVNTAARLQVQAVAAPGEILLDSGTANSVRARVPARACAPLHIRGRPKPILVGWAGALGTGPADRTRLSCMRTANTRATVPERRMFVQVTALRCQACKPSAQRVLDRTRHLQSLTKTWAGQREADRSNLGGARPRTRLAPHAVADAAYSRTKNARLHRQRRDPQGH
jgi:hypothetical protein